MTKQIWFDMDGTIADLYGARNWLERIIDEEDMLFECLYPLCNPDELKDICTEFAMNGWTVGIITWTPMNATKEYAERVAEEKRRWVQNWFPFIEDIRVQPYGQPKQYALTQRADEMILVDDNIEVRKMWEKNPHRTTIDATDTKRMLKELRKLLDK